MRIDRIEVKNFKGFEERTFDFPRSSDASKGGNGSFHLIIGKNGLGKTSALDALAVAMGGWLKGIPDVGRFDSRYIKKSDIRVITKEIEGAIRVNEQYPVEIKACGLIDGKSVEWSRSKNSGEQGRTNRNQSNRVARMAKTLAESRMHGKEMTAPLLSYYGAGRLWNTPKEMLKVDEEQDQNGGGESNGIGSGRGSAAGAGNGKGEGFGQRLFVKEDVERYEIYKDWRAGYRYSVDPRCSPSDLIYWLKMEEVDSVQMGKETVFFKTVKRAIMESLRVEGCRGVMFHLRRNELMVDFEGHGCLPFGMLSDGQRNMVAMIGDIAYKAAQLNAHLKEEILEKTPGIVLIDELDLHLHPCWQRHVVEDLRRIFPEIQFIATTHSPFIVQTMRDGEVIPLDAQAIPEVGNLDIDKIAQGLMGVSRTDVSPRYEEMVKVAKDFLITLNEAAIAPSEKLAEYEAKLSEGLGPYASNPAFQAFLELKKEARLGQRLSSRNDHNKPTSAED